MATQGTYSGTLADQAMQWLADVTETGREKAFHTVGPADQLSHLSDGRALCELINVLQGDCVPRRDRSNFKDEDDEPPSFCPL